MSEGVAKPDAPTYRRILTHSILMFAGQSLMQLVDLLFCRDLGSVATATVGTASTLFAWFIIIGTGISSSLEFLIPNSIGSGNSKRANEYFYAGLVVVLLSALVSGVSLVLISHLGALYGMNEQIITPVKDFCLVMAFSFIAVFMVPIMRVELQARGHSNDATYAFILGNIINLVFNYALVLGHFGVPAYGVMGSAYSSLIARYSILLYLGFRLYGVRSRNQLHLKLSEIPFLKRVIEILKMGIPSSLHMLFEMGAFILAGILASRFSPPENAAHSIALCIASFAFMIPAGMGSAATLTMSRAMGEGDSKLAAQLGYLTIKLGLGYSAVTSLIFLISSQFLVTLYTSDVETIRIGSGLLIIAAIFQFGDGAQAILAGCLRGLGITKTQAKVNAFGHWVLGVPIGILLSFNFGMRITGLWIGLSIGLFSVAVILFYYFYRQTQLILKSQRNDEFISIASE